MMLSQEQLIGDGLFISFRLLLLVLLFPFPVEGGVLPRAVELLDFAVALARQVHAEFSKGLPINKKAGLKPRYFFWRPIFEWMVLAQRIEQNVVGSQLVAALLILTFNLLLDQILNVLACLRLSGARAARAVRSISCRSGAQHICRVGCFVGCAGARSWVRCLIRSPVNFVAELNVRVEGSVRRQVLLVLVLL